MLYTLAKKMTTDNSGHEYVHKLPAISLVELAYGHVLPYILLFHMRLFSGCLSDRDRYNDLSSKVNLTSSLYASLPPVVLHWWPPS